MSIYYNKYIKENNNSLPIDDKTEEHIEDYESSSGNVIIREPKDLEDLEKQYNDYQSIPVDQQRMSDDKSIQLFGMTNIDHYEKLRSKFLSNLKEGLDDHFDIEFEEDDSQEHRIEDETDIDKAKDWCQQTMLYLIIPTKNPDELDEYWSHWNSMTVDQKRMSDTKAIELFNMTNEDIYNKYSNLINHKEINGREEIKLINVSENINNIIETIKYNIVHEDRRTVLGNIIKLISEETNNIIEDTLVTNVIDNTIEFMHNDVCRIFDTVEDLPYFSPIEMEDKGVFIGNTYYNIDADNGYIDEEKKIKTSVWFENYKAIFNGYITQDRTEYTKLWTNKLYELYSDYNSIKESGNINIINARKQSILELGWNPELPFTPIIRHKVTQNMKDKIRAKYENVKFTDLSAFVESASNEQLSNTSESTDNKFPVYVVLSYTGTTFGKVVRKFTDAIYTHAAISLDSKMNRLYSYNIAQHGFSLENISKYNNSKDNVISIYTFFLNKKSYQKLKMKLDYFISNKENTKYSFINLLGALINKPIKLVDEMICSQFVDSLMKYVNLDITHKDSSLVKPQDFANITDSRFIKLYEGPIKDYDSLKVSNTIKSLLGNIVVRENVEIINEAQYIKCINDNISNLGMLSYLNEHSDILSGNSKRVYDAFLKPLFETYICETKEFPIQFDKEGNLLIKNMKKIDFESEYSQSHKLLLVYEKNSNIEGMKYELSKLWFLNVLLEKKIYDKNNQKDKDDIHKVRARILNDFNKYLKIVTKDDKEFNFTQYYESTPFSDATIKIDNHTLKYGGKFIKHIATKLIM